MAGTGARARARPSACAHACGVQTVDLVKSSFSKEYLDSVSIDPRAQGATMRELWQRRWAEDYVKLFAFP